MDLAWAAGLFEGEGCFTFNPDNGQPVARMSMVDLDVMNRFVRVVGIGKLRVNARPGRKPIWEWSAQRFETVQYIAALFWSELGDRRKAQVASTFQKYNDWPRRRRSLTYPTCANGHDRGEHEHVQPSGDSVCLQCCRDYSARYRARKVVAAHA